MDIKMYIRKKIYFYAMKICKRELKKLHTGIDTFLQHILFNSPTKYIN